MKPSVVRMSILALLVVWVASAIAVAQAPAPQNGSAPAPAATPPAAQPAPAPAKPGAQTPARPGAQVPGKPAQAAATPVPGVVPPPGYVIGPEDVLTVYFWREKDMSGDVAVRPDGKISLPLLNDVHAAGLTPEELRAQLTEAAGKLIEEPNVTVVVKAINSRKIFVTGQVNKPGPYPLTAPTTVLQAIATAGGLLEYADSKEIRVLRTEGGKQVSHKFNYKDVIKGKNLRQNVELRPGDTIIVP